MKPEAVSRKNGSFSKVSLCLLPNEKVCPVMLEAMACRKALLTTRVEGMQESNSGQSERTTLFSGAVIGNNITQVV